MKNNKTDVIIIVVCCVLIAACAAFLLWKFLPQKNATAGTTTAESEFKPTVSYDPDFLFDFAGEDLTKYLTLGEYKNLTVNTTVRVRTEKEIEEEITKVVNMFATEIKITDREIAYDDVVCVDLVLIADGEEVSGTDETDVYISVTSDKENKVAPDLVGHKPGETVFSDVTEDIKANTDYASKVGDAEKIEYKFTVKFIRDEEIPERTDEFAKENLGFDTFDQFVESYTKTVSLKYALSNDKELYSNIMSAAFKNCTVISAPADYVENMFNYYKYMYEYYAYANKMTYEKFMAEKVGMTDDELKANVEESIMQEIMLYSIANAEELNATDEEITAFAEEKGKSENMSAKEFIEKYGRETVEEYVTTNKASEYLMGQTQIVYAEDTSDATSTKTAE